MTDGTRNLKQNLSPNFETPSLIRVFDLFVSGVGLLLLAPVFVVVGLIIKFISAGPVFYTAKRVGRNERLFKLYKFRSMYLDADRKGPGITFKDDPRVTSIGRFLRRTKLDELPQLINVFLGQMSLVGPRPENPEYVALYTPWQRQVLTVRPGITSMASLHYREEETLLSGDNWETTYRNQILPHKLALDVNYLKERTVWTDLGLILQTVFALFQGEKLTSTILKLRNRYIFLLDLVVLSLTPALALTLRLDGTGWWPQLRNALIFFTAATLLVKLLVFYWFDLYNRYWRYAGFNELMRVLVAINISMILLTGLFAGLYTFLEQYGLAMYRTVPIIEGLLTIIVIGGSRFSLRGLYHWRRQYQSVVGGRRVLIVGAGEAGAMVVREIRANPQLDMEPVAFIDDDFAKVGIHIQGLRVFGDSQAIPKIVKEHKIQRIVVAIPSSPLRRQQEIIAICEETGVVTHNSPGIYEILGGHKTISHVPRFDINYLLHRSPIKVDQTEVNNSLQGATVLVTGAGGSIGSELCHQIAQSKPEKIILLGHGENSIFEINLDLHLANPNLTTCPVIVDVKDTARVDMIVEKYRPHIIFHAAAHKHVHFMQDNVKEAVTNNVLGTENVLQAAEKYDVERFVLISTDKAVNATSIMGATKRMAELLMAAAAHRTGRAYMAVRFGNVLGSRGSVIPVFQRQIAKGGPVTLTHPDMRRYFMTIPEAVQLVLQASILGQGGEVFVLDMAKPVRILDLATDLIKLAGLRPEHDIEIIYTGARPGEKLNEELFLSGEDYQCTKHAKIFMTSHKGTFETEVLEQVVVELIRLTKQEQSTSEQIKDLLPKICYYLDKYQPQSSQPEPESIKINELLSLPESPTFSHKRLILPELTNAV